jgi:hypothetical protein
MATKYWRGGAAAVGQVTTITFSAYTSGQTYTCTINGKSISYLAVASTITDVVNGLLAAWQATTEPEFAEATPTNSSGLRLTAITLGVPFTVTASATGGITATVTATTAPSGPNFFTNAQNWVGGSLPSSGDHLVFENSTVDLLYSIEDTATNYGNITVDSSFTATIGLPAMNSANYAEYRPRFLKLGDGSSGYNLTIGMGNGRQSSRILIDANAGDVVATIYGTGFSSNAESPVVIKNNGSASTLDLYSGSVYLDADTSGTLSAVRVTPAQNAQAIKLTASATVACGAVVASGGEIEIRGGATSIVAGNNAIAKFVMAATCPTVTVKDGARILWNSTAGITTKMFIQGRGTIDFSGNGAAKTVAATDLYAGGTVRDPIGNVTYTGGIAIQGAKLSDCTIDVGTGRTLAVS